MQGFVSEVAYHDPDFGTMVMGHVIELVDEGGDDDCGVYHYLWESSDGALRGFVVSGWQSGRKILQICDRFDVKYDISSWTGSRQEM